MNNTERAKTYNEALKDPDLMRALMQSLEAETVKTHTESFMKKALNKSIFEKKMISILPDINSKNHVIRKPMNKSKLANLLEKKRKGPNYEMSIMYLKKQNEKDTGLPRVKVVDVPGDGDCFYRALILAANEQGILDLLKVCLNINVVSKITPLIQGLRNFVSDHIDKRATEAYQVLYHLFYEDTDTLLAVIDTTFAQWHKDALTSALEHDNQDEFVASIKAGIRQRGNWASEIEVKFLESKLKECGIELNVSNTILGRARKTKPDGTEVITLYNSSDVHFQYFSFDVEPLAKTRGGKKQNRKTRRCYKSASS